MLAYLFVLLAVGVRFMQHPWTFTPVVAALLFFGARGSRKQMWIPLALLIGSDLILTRFVYSYPFTWDQLIIWVWYAAILWLGTNLRENARPLRLVGAALASSVSFFVVSNFGVWAATTIYPKTMEGLLACYAAAVPFFRHAVEGDLVFTLAMFATPVVLHAVAGAFEKSNHIAAA